METPNIVLATISIMLLIEGLILAIWPKSLIKLARKKLKEIQGFGLIELIIALIILFLMAL